MGSPAVVERLSAEVGELIARHEGRSRQDLARYADDFPGFCRDVLSVELWSAQLTMGETVLGHPRTVIVSGHSTGKDFWAAAFGLWWVYARQGRVIITAASARQAVGIVMALVRRLWVSTELAGELFSTELRIDEVAVITAFATDNSARLTGWHHARLLVVMSEAQGIEPEAWEAVAACATSPENRIVAYGNPTSPTGPFYEAAHSAQWKCLTVPATEHPNIVTGLMEVPGGPSREWVQYMADEYGITSSIYGSRVLARFPTEAIEAITTRAALEAAFLRHETPTSESVVALGRTPHLAWDVALRGEDLNALAVCQGHFVRELLTWRADDMNDSYGRIDALAAAVVEMWSTPLTRKRAREAAYFGRPPVRPTMIVDESGMGGPACDELRRRGFHVVGFIGAATPSAGPYGGGSRYLNRRAEAYFLLRLALEKTLVALPRNALLAEEALTTQWTINGQDKIQIITKDEVRRQLGRSPDLLDAVTMGLWFILSAEARGQWGSSSFIL